MAPATPSLGSLLSPPFEMPRPSRFHFIAVVIRTGDIRVLWSYGNPKDDFQCTRAVGGTISSTSCLTGSIHFVSEAVASRLEEQEMALIRACDIANQDLDVTEIEKAFDGIFDEMAEPQN